MGQILFLRTGGSSGGSGGAQSLQAAYNGGRDLQLVYGPLRIQAEGEGLLSGESALMVGTDDPDKDVSLLTLAKIFPHENGGATSPPLVIGNLGSTGPAIQVFGVPNTNVLPDLSQDLVDTVGLDVVTGGPDQGHHTLYSLHGIRWLKWQAAGETPGPEEVARLALTHVPEDDFDYGSIAPQERTRLTLRVAENETRPVARFYSTLIPIDADEGPMEFEVAHGLACVPVVVQVYRQFLDGNGDQAIVQDRDVEVRILDTMRVRLTFNGSPQGGDTYHVAVTGC